VKADQLEWQTSASDDHRFIWESERNGWLNYYLYDLSGQLINPLTSHDAFESRAIVTVDEAAGAMFYMARDGENHMKLQLHRVGLDGTGDVRLTDPRFTHAVSLSPDNRYFVDVYQTHDTPPATQLVDAATGEVVRQLAASDLARFEALGLRPVEQFTCTAADGRTTLYGTIAFPSDFDPSRRYPVMVPVIGALQQAGKSFEVQVGPDAGHSGVNQQPHARVFRREPDHASRAADGRLSGAGSDTAGTNGPLATDLNRTSRPAGRPGLRLLGFDILDFRGRVAVSAGDAPDDIAVNLR